MKHNVGSNERIVRLAIGAAASAAAVRAPRPWQKAALGAIATSGPATALTRYCPINAALGVGESELSPLEQGLRDMEIRRQTAINAAMGEPPSRTTGTALVTSGRDLLGQP
jgi:DUF2892 family protein